eukprot:5883045-Alexandrium_andersonii.AAC.1
MDGPQDVRGSSPRISGRLRFTGLAFGILKLKAAPAGGPKPDMLVGGARGRRAWRVARPEATARPPAF